MCFFPCCSRKLGGGSTAQPSVWSRGVVVLPPRLDEPLRIGDAEEPGAVQALVAQSAVEAFAVRVLHWSARADERQGHADAMCPAIQRLPGELGPVVTDNAARQPARCTQALEHGDHAPRWQGVPDLDGQALAGEVVDHGQTSERAAVGEHVAHEIHRPAFGWRGGLRERHPCHRGAPDKLPEVGRIVTNSCLKSTTYRLRGSFAAGSSKGNYIYFTRSGARIDYVAMKPWEYEVLICPGTRFKIVGIRWGPAMRATPSATTPASMPAAVT